MTPTSRRDGPLSYLRATTRISTSFGDKQRDAAETLNPCTRAWPSVDVKIFLFCFKNIDHYTMGMSFWKDFEADT